MRTYILGMRITTEFYKQPLAKGSVPFSEASDDFFSLVQAREIAFLLAAAPDMRADAVVLEDARGVRLETWLKLDGQWSLASA